MSTGASPADLHSLTLGPDVSLTCEELESAAQTKRLTLQLTDAAQHSLRDARAALESARERGDEVYGVTTGFGPLVDFQSAESGGTLHGAGLLAHLSTGSGALASREVARAMCIARLQSLAQGYSAIRLTALERFASLIEHGITPAIPEIGSVGASGDLTPLAHAARVMTGTGRVLRADGSIEPAENSLNRIGIEPLDLDGRDALALVNGTAFMTAYAALALARMRRIVRHLERLTGWMYRLLGCELQALDPRLHAARGHNGQCDSAASIRTEALRHGPFQRSDNRPLQEPYSIRCAPQVIGACRDQIAYAKNIIETELNGVNDNPVVISGDDPAVLHGGNFQGQQIALAADALNAAITQMGVLAERQIDLLLTPARNGDAPLLLAWTPGATSGLAGAQITATALVSELRHHAQMTATSSIPTNGDNQDVVSMGTLSGRTAYEQTERLAPILSVLGIALAQLTHLRDADRATGPASPVPPWMPSVEPIVEDRPLRAEIDRLAQHWLSVNADEDSPD
ncbi:histidine ammonia-lyase [Longibacter salinarum]|uniref:Histidine ammonia-lyase n=1 Tax=Longibacter salinarum TaxID=1850348 RepID=A0A2A8D122_9BACT|nr:aromatic amino acid ammonia-lyase [Longibacter salinarum]PEN14580.1 histidine ammonia-lyase [Longibacter salinarum]